MKNAVFGPKGKHRPKIDRMKLKTCLASLSDCVILSVRTRNSAQQPPITAANLPTRRLQ